MLIYVLSALLINTLNCKIPELDQKNVQIKNWTDVETKIKALIDGTHEKLQVYLLTFMEKVMSITLFCI